MKQPLAVNLKKSEVIGGFIWLFVYLVPLAVVLELILLQLGYMDDNGVMLNGVYFFVSFLLTALVFHRFLADSLPPVWQHFGRVLKAVLLGFCLYECAEILLGIGTELIFPDYTVPNDDNIGALAGANYAVIWVGAVLLAPLTEETLLRGLIFGTLRRWNRPAAYIISSMLFAAAHIAGYLPDMDGASIVINLLIYALPGAALAATYEYGGTIWASILLHMLLNFMGMSALA